MNKQDEEEVVKFCAEFGGLKTGFQRLWTSILLHNRHISTNTNGVNFQILDRQSKG